METFQQNVTRENSAMKVVAFNGSARKDGNTAGLIRTVLAVLEDEGIETEMVQLAGKSIHGCTACYQCFEREDDRCAVDDDDLNECLEKMLNAEGIILGSPTYFADVTAEMKGLIDRCGLVYKANGDSLRHKIGAAAVAVRRAGSIHAFDTINHFFTINQMIVPGSSYWNMGFGHMGKDEVASDQEAQDTMRTLGKNMAWVLECLHG